MYSPICVLYIFFTVKNDHKKIYTCKIKKTEYKDIF